jgi:hypothetical protein
MNVNDEAPEAGQDEMVIKPYGIQLKAGVLFHL